MGKIKVRYQILLGYFLPLAVFAIMGYLTHGQLESVAGAFAEAQANHELLTLNAQIQKALVDTETGCRGFLLTGQENFLEPMTSGQATVERLLPIILEKVEGQSLPTQRWSEVRRIYEQQLKPWQLDAAAQRRQRGLEAAAAMMAQGTDKRSMDSIRDLTSEISRYREGEVARAQQDVQRTRERAAATVTACLLVGLLFSLGAGFLVARGIGNQLSQSTQNLSSFAVELAATAEEQERTLKAQVVSVSETSTTMEELEVSFQHSLKAAESSAENARSASVVAQDGNPRVEQAVTTMRGIQESVSGLAGQITQLSDQVSQIGSITGLVGDLANRTHLLAVNASVEAARAGEHGRGFGVVALEIRKLADQSKTSAEKIAVLVNDIQRATNGAVMAAESGIRAARDGQGAAQGAGNAFRQLTDALEANVESAQQAALNVAQQSAAVRQVVTAVESLNLGAQQTSAGLSQTYVGIRRLRETSQRLAEMV